MVRSPIWSDSAHRLVATICHLGARKVPAPRGQISAPSAMAQNPANTRPRDNIAPASFPMRKNQALLKAHEFPSRQKSRSVEGNGELVKSSGIAVQR